ncbi:DUF6438 domain-containing protein [Tenacibaculum aestuariivivum]|uniref:DUF6438 domain-containing protein n=1 Tax=Tenacibaculum aestuariivivum TaxID=2006131 RepID=UPI003AB4F5F4
MKYILVLFSTLLVACGIFSKKTEKNKVTKEQLIVIFKDPKNIENAKTLLKNSGLTFSKMAYDKPFSKIGIVTVPKKKSTFWLNRLQQTNAFKLVAINTDNTLTKLIEKEDKTLISIRKTPCFGTCAVYEIIIDKEGNMFYNGIQFVQKKGNYKLKLSDKQFKKLNEMFSEKDFNNFKEVYENPRISDLPTTFITYKGKQVKIRLWKNIPNELITIHEYIESILVVNNLLK